MPKDCHPFASGFILAKQVFIFHWKFFNIPSLTSCQRHPCRSVFQDNKVNLSQSLDVVINVFAAKTISTWNFHIKAWILQHKITPRRISQLAHFRDVSYKTFLQQRLALQPILSCTFMYISPHTVLLTRDTWNCWKDPITGLPLSVNKCKFSPMDKLGNVFDFLHIVRT